MCFRDSCPAGQQNYAPDSSEKQEREGAVCDDRLNRDVSAIVAACLMLIKVLGVCVPVAELASWTVITLRTVAITLFPRVASSRARGPASAALASPRLQRC